MILAGERQPHIAFRTDASLAIGTGHVMRCLTLADILREQGAVCRFICRPHDGNLMALLKARRYEVVKLSLPCSKTGSGKDVPEDTVTEPFHTHWLGVDWAKDAAETSSALWAGGTDWLVVDHYALDCRWEQALRPKVRQLMVIDDLADRDHSCDLLVDQTLGRVPADYAPYVEPGTRLLLGSEFALLRPEFRRLRKQSLRQRAEPALRRILVTMGGIDQDNVTGAVLDMLDRCVLPEGVRIVVVMGPAAPWLAQVRQRAALMAHPTEVLIDVDDMAQLMADSDLAIGAGGGTSWERCCMGLPSICLILAANQSAIAATLDAAGAAVAVGSPNEIAAVLARHDSPDSMAALLRGMADASARITDGAGALRVAQKMAIHHD